MSEAASSRRARDAAATPPVPGDTDAVIDLDRRELLMILRDLQELSDPRPER